MLCTLLIPLSISTKLTQQFRIWVLQPPVAAVLTAECHASNAKLRIRRMNPPLQEVFKHSFMPYTELLKLTDFFS
jgi:hypothetical protein